VPSRPSILLHLNDVDDDERDVVLLCHLSRLPIVYLGEQAIRKIKRRARLMVANHFFKLAVAKGIASRILRFNDAVGVKQETVAWIERQAANRIVGVRATPNSSPLLSMCCNLPSRQHRSAGCPAAEYRAWAISISTHKKAADTNWFRSWPERMRFNLRSTSAGSCAQDTTDCTATLIIDAMSAAGTPCPETSATSTPKRCWSNWINP